MPPQAAPLDRELVDQSNSQVDSDYESTSEIDSTDAGENRTLPSNNRTNANNAPINDANARIAANTAQLLQQLSPLFNQSSTSSSRNPLSTLFSQTHSYIRHTLFVEFFYIYLLDRSLLLLLIRFMAYIILLFVKKNKRQATIFWTSLLVCMLMLHVLEVVLVPSWFFEWDGLLRNYGPSMFNWLKTQSDSPFEYWSRRGMVLLEIIFCDLAIWAVGYLSIWIEWKKDSLEYLRGAPRGGTGGEMHDDITNTEDNTSETGTHTNDDEIHITINNDIIEGSSAASRVSASSSQSNSGGATSQSNGSNSPQQNLIHRRRTSSNAQDMTELQDVSDRSNLLTHRQGGENETDLFDEI